MWAVIQRELETLPVALNNHSRTALQTSAFHVFCSPSLKLDVEQDSELPSTFISINPFCQGVRGAVLCSCWGRHSSGAAAGSHFLPVPCCSAAASAERGLL